MSGIGRSPKLTAHDLAEKKEKKDGKKKKREQGGVWESNRDRIISGRRGRKTGERVGKRGVLKAGRSKECWLLDQVEHVI
jgi:hypothetical protein